MKKIGVQVRTTIETTKRMECRVNAANLIEMMEKTGIEVPKGATVQFVVPGGGNWSGSAIDIDDENPILVEWKTQEVEGN